LRPNYRIAPLTAVIVLLTPGAQELGPLASAYNRILEISLGSIVGLGVALLLMPARAHGLVINAAARLGLLADLLHDW
ncbi:MAG: FUSC family protein, partial [Xanthobacteraceae bacterium]